MKASSLTKHYRPALAVVAISLLTLSLQHLATGIQAVTGAEAWHSWLMAIGIDGALVAVELAALAGVRSGWVRAILISACVLSAGFNILGFLEHAQGMLGQSLAVSLGVFVPFTVYGLTDTLTRTKPRRILKKAKR